jgi:predicted O-linked N-acetylglucosamine transferase (SPINDLY family)
VATFHARACPALAYRAPHCAAPKARRDGLRVGFASAHFDGHTIARLNRGLIDGLDRECFEVATFDLGPRGLADPFTAREAIAAAELDILYFPDIGMEPVSYFLGFARLAPVQCVTWGHPVTTGLPEIDYFVSIDAAEPVGAEASYSETLVRLPVFSTKVAPATAEPRPRGALGLPDAAHLYVCPQSLFKMHPDFDAALRGILDADPHASLLFVEGPQPHWREILETRWRKSFDFRRVRFLPRMPRADYLSCLAAADVVLDTFHFCGGHTSYEALALGKPVITLPGAFLRGRLTLAMLAQLGLDATVADNTDDYVRRAVAFGTDADLRTAFTRELAARRPLLFDDHRAVAAHERFFLDATAKAFC